MLRQPTLLLIAVLLIIIIEDGTGKVCKSVNCGGKIKNCPYGYEKKDGCEICRCYDPCNPPGKAVLCGPTKRCFVDKKIDGTFVTRCGTTKMKRSENACEQEKIIGLCKAAFPRFYYNSTLKSCEPFVYGGCGGNNNNFETKDACQTKCLV